MKTKNSCGSRGCKVRIILPHDGSTKPLFGEMLRKRHDSTAVLSLLGLPLDKVALKKAA